MRIGAGPGPDGGHQHQSTHCVYDARSGVIVSTYHFAGAAPRSETERREAMLKAAHEASGIPIEHLAALTNPEVPAGEGALSVDHAAKRLIRKGGGVSGEIPPGEPGHRK